MYRRVKLKEAVSFASLLLFVVLLQGPQTTGGFGYDLENTFETEVNSLVELEKRTLRSLQERSSLALPAPAPEKGVNRAFLEEAIEDLLRKRSYAVRLDPCYLHLDKVRKSCEDTNSTLTQRDCFASCVPKQTGDICYRLWDPELYGETNILVEKRWYFDEQTQRCMVFDYGGCLGNANNYLSQSDCQLQNNLEVTAEVVRVSRTNLKQIESYGECNVFGNAHFNTFDNKTYTFYGKCNYVLAEAQDPIQQTDLWRVTLMNDPRCADPRRPCQKMVAIHIGGEGGPTIILGEKVGNRFRVEVNDQTITSFPHDISDSDLNIDLSLTTLHPAQPEKILLRSWGDNVVIIWDGERTLDIRFPDSFKRFVTRGLCGSFNDDISDEFLDYSNQYQQNVNVFAASYKSSTPDSPCTELVVTPEDCVLQCHELDEEYFAPCDGVIDKDFFKDLCKKDRCASKSPSLSGESAAAVCAILDMYSRQCALQNVSLDWRKDANCEHPCPSTMEYQDAAPACARLCETRHQTNCNLKSVSGCTCKEDMYWDGSKCVEAENCPCYYEGKAYEEGKFLYRPREVCRCENGEFNCRQTTYQATCSILGFTNLQTFDGLQYEVYPTDCKYTLFRDCSSQTLATQYSIKIENKECQSTVVSDYCKQQNLQVKYRGKQIDIKRTMAENGSLTVEVFFVENGYEEQVTEYIHDDQGFRLNFVGIRNVILSTDEFDLVVTAENVYVMAKKKAGDKTCGLCGTSNNNKNDDLSGPTGYIAGSATAFLRLWIDERKSNGTCSGELGDLEPTAERNYCNLKTDNAPWALENANVMKQPAGPFGKCSKNANLYYSRAKKSGCRHIPSLCHVVAGFAKDCRDDGYEVRDWREYITNCKKPTCPPGLVFKSCETNCPQTCGDVQNHNADCNNRKCIEGCYCQNSSEVLMGDKCVRKDVCLKELEAGAYTLADLLESANCTGGRTWSASGKTCKGLASLDQSETTYGCHCKPGLYWNDFKQKCVEMTQCGCEEEGVYYEAFETHPTLCSLICSGSRSWVVDPHRQDELTKAECQATGQDHYRKFNGDWVNFRSKQSCGYTMMKIKATMHQIKVSNEYCKESFELLICKKVVITTDHGQIELLQKDIKITKGGNTMEIGPGKYPQPCEYNGLPYTEIFSEGVFTFVRVFKPNNRISPMYEVKYDRGNRVYIKANIEYKDTDELRGLCGALTTETGLNIGMDNSWTEDVGCEAIRIPSDALEICEEHKDRYKWAQQGCEVLMSEDFEVCHQAVRVNDYYHNCLYETCLCHQGGDCGCFCASVADYVEACNQHGIAVPWRREGLCGWRYFDDRNVTETSEERVVSKYAYVLFYKRRHTVDVLQTDAEQVAAQEEMENVEERTKANQEDVDENELD